VQCARYYCALLVARVKVGCHKKCDFSCGKVPTRWVRYRPWPVVECCTLVAEAAKHGQSSYRSARSVAPPKSSIQWSFSATSKLVPFPVRFDRGFGSDVGSRTPRNSLLQRLQGVGERALLLETMDIPTQAVLWLEWAICQKGRVGLALTLPTPPRVLFPSLIHLGRRLEVRSRDARADQCRPTPATSRPPKTEIASKTRLGMDARPDAGFRCRYRRRARMPSPH